MPGPQPIPWEDRWVPEPNSGCHLWLLGTDKDGYGKMKIAGVDTRAHRVSWERTNGRAVPAGFCVLHSCDVPSCVNPDHLFLGTTAENNHDRDRKGRARRGGCMRGVSLQPGPRCYQAQIWRDGRCIYLGYFKTELEAHQAYLAAKAEAMVH